MAVVFYRHCNGVRWVSWMEYGRVVLVERMDDVLGSSILLLIILIKAIK